MNDIIKDFEFMINKAELQALSNKSLENPLTEKEYDRMIKLKKEVFE